MSPGLAPLLNILIYLSIFVASSCTTISGWFGGGSKDFRDANSIPGRSGDAPSGSAFADQLRKLNLEQREEAILAQVQKGNLPAFYRKFRPVTVSARLPNGKTVKATYWVAPDYIGVGTDGDFLRTPMTPMTAQRICDRFNMLLPTRKMVNDIYKQANVKLPPSPMKAGNEMVGIDYYARHQATVEGQLRGASRDSLIAGHKKDIVNTNRLVERPLQVAIYGWHRLDGNPIQPLSLVHINTYADYSHGVRLIQESMVVDGNVMKVRDVLRDPQLNVLMSDEGPVANSKVPTTVHPRSFPRLSRVGGRRSVSRS